MTDTVDDQLHVELSGAWFALPAPDEDAEAAIQGIVTTLGPLDEAADREVRAGLAAVIPLAHSLAPGSRISHALIPNPASGRVQALLSVRLTRITPDAHANYLAAARAYAGGPGVEVINRVVEEVRLPVGPGVLSRDFTLPIEREGVPDPVLERCFLAVFPEGFETAVEFTLLTQNLALFDDTGSYLMALAAGERVREPGEDATP